jgi:hypothetical protein
MSFHHESGEHVADHRVPRYPSSFVSGHRAIVSAGLEHQRSLVLSEKRFDLGLLPTFTAARVNLNLNLLLSKSRCWRSAAKV